MAIFGKREEAPQPVQQPKEPAPLVAAPKPAMPSYGIVDVIRLMRTLPVDQQPDLVVRVIRSTLESVNVHTSSLLEDAAKQQQRLGERVSALQAQIEELLEQIDTHRSEVTRLESELAEIGMAKERLQHAEHPTPSRMPPLPIGTGQLPPPSPPPKMTPSRPPETVHTQTTKA